MFSPIFVHYRYGIHLKVIHTSSDVTEKLTLLLKQCAFYLQQQQRPEQRGGHAKISILITMKIKSCIPVLL